MKRGLTALALAGLGGCADAATGELQNLSVTADRLQEAFNRGSERVRLVLVFSPT